MNPNILKSNTIAAAFALTDTETITITRKTPTGGGNFTPSTVYSGVADVQMGNGSMYYNPQGAVEQSDGKILIMDSNSTLPAILIDDTVTYAGNTYKVVNSNPVMTFGIRHVSLLVKRGTAGHYGPMR